MRIPIWLSVLLVLATVSLTWWLGSRHYDFLGPLPETDSLAGAPPADAASEAPDTAAEPLVEPPQAPLETTGPPTATPPLPLPLPLPLISHDDPDLPAALDAYLLESRLGTAELAARATALEQAGKRERALLAWERVLDSGNPALSWRGPAQTAIRRLRDSLPPWNQDPDESIALMIQIGADIRFGDTLELAATEAATQIEHASSGVLRVEALVTLGEAAGPETEALPVAVWITDNADPPKSSTEVLSFTTPPEEAAVLNRRILATIYDLVRGRLEKERSWAPLPILDGEGDPLDALETALTRRAWDEFGKSLQTTE